MSETLEHREHHAASPVRCAVVWLVATVLFATCVLCCLSAGRAPLLELREAAGPGAVPQAASSPSSSAVLLLASLAGTVACLRLWWVVAQTCWRGARGSTLSGSGLTRRLTLAACGLVVTATAVAPAHASNLDGLDGLPLPQRPVSGTLTPGTPTPGADAAPVTVAPDVVPAERPEAMPDALPVPPPETQEPRAARHVVVSGDSLWKIAGSQVEASPGSSVTDAAIQRHVNALHASNRALVGSDPDLIAPGQELLLPSPAVDTTEENR